MNDQNPSSGSRWEPQPGSVPSPAGEPATATAETGPGASGHDSATAAVPPAAGRRRARFGSRRHVLAAGAVVGVLALGGIGAAAVGHAVADGGGPGRSADADAGGAGRVGHHHGDDGDGPGAGGVTGPDGTGTGATGPGTGAATPGTGTTPGGPTT